MCPTHRNNMYLILAGVILYTNYSFSFYFVHKLFLENNFWQLCLPWTKASCDKAYFVTNSTLKVPNCWPKSRKFLSVRNALTKWHKGKGSFQECTPSVWWKMALYIVISGVTFELQKNNFTFSFIKYMVEMWNAVHKRFD